MRIDIDESWSITEPVFDGEVHGRRCRITYGEPVTYIYIGFSKDEWFLKYDTNLHLWCCFAHVANIICDYIGDSNMIEIGNTRYTTFLNIGTDDDLVWFKFRPGAVITEYNKIFGIPMDKIEDIFYSNPNVLNWDKGYHKQLSKHLREQKCDDDCDHKTFTVDMCLEILDRMFVRVDNCLGTLNNHIDFIRNLIDSQCKYNTKRK